MIDHPTLIAKFQDACSAPTMDETAFLLSYMLMVPGSLKSAQAAYFRVLDKRKVSYPKGLDARWEVFRGFCEASGIVLPEKAAGRKSDSDFFASFAASAR